MAPNPQKALTRYFGFTAFREGQLQAIESALQKKDTLVVMPTGTGKSLCYQLPALMLSGLTLVVSPLIALMKDQVDFLQSVKISATFINSSIPQTEQNKRLARVLDGQCKILYVAPERFRIEGFREILQKLDVSLFAIDEAHCISLWGHDFRPDYLRLNEVITDLNHPPTLALTATATKHVQQDIIKRLNLRNPTQIVTGFNRPNLTFRVYQAYGDESKQDVLRRLVLPRIGSAIVYVGTRRQAEQVAFFIAQELRIKAERYHAGLPENERTLIQNRFMNNEIQVIVSTNAFGMGVDKPDVRLVLHYSLPGSLEAYYQESGRAGRDGKRSGCILLYDPTDCGLYEWFIENDSPDYQDLQAIYDRLNDMAHQGRARFSVQRLCDMLAINDIQVRVGLRYLESAEAIENLTVNYKELGLQIRKLDPRKLERVVKLIAERRHHKYAMLDQMVNYAETLQCRRKTLLDYFGDRSDPKAIKCCDNCDPKTPTRQNHRASIEFIIVDAITRHHMRIGVEKLAKILKGSTQDAIVQHGHMSNPYYEFLKDWNLQDIIACIIKLLKAGYLERIRMNSFRVLDITEKGAQLLKGARFRFQPKKQKPKVASFFITLNLFKQGLDIHEIAENRNLKPGTIYTHLALAIETGHLDLNQVISSAREKVIRKAISESETSALADIKDILPPDVDYGEIKCVVADMNRS
ncbi:RecQ family ATP-dependent DNA helicase [candidate division KSB1 bacterium]|nr:RecQ family ATP-dependent DNA helicase [candidate division KSB1 bacterium]